MSVCAVVVTYNRLERLRECVAALEALTEPCDLLVVDNASADATAEWLRQLSYQRGRVEVLTLSENTGGAGGFNAGMRRACELGYDLLWLMDDDCCPEPTSLAQLLRAAECLDEANVPWGWLSSVALWTNGHICQMNRPYAHADFAQSLNLLSQGLLMAAHATFVALLVPRRSVERYGLPIKEFFIWADDLEWTRRIAVRGAEPGYVVGASRVVHNTALNEGSSIALDDANRLPRYRLAYRNEAYLWRQEGLKGCAHYTLKLALNAWRILTRGRGHRLKRLAVLARGFAEGIFFRPKVEMLSPHNQVCNKP